MGNFGKISRGKFSRSQEILHNEYLFPIPNMALANVSINTNLNLIDKFPLSLNRKFSWWTNFKGLYTSLLETYCCDEKT